MTRRLFLTALGAFAVLPVGQILAQTAGTGVTVIRTLADAPASGADGDAFAGYVVLIPTHEETRATVELLQAMATVASTVASGLNASRDGTLFTGDPLTTFGPGAGISSAVAVGSFFVGDPLTGAFSAAASGQAIAELNERFNFGLDPSGGAILLFVGGHPSTASATEVFSQVYSTNDPATIAASLQAASWGNTKGTPNETLPQALQNVWNTTVAHFTVNGTTPHPPRPPRS